MGNFFSLKIVDVLKPVFEKLQINYPMMRKILEIKLIMDGRRVPTVFNNSKETNGNKFLMSLGLYALFSLMLLFFVFGDNIMLQMSIVFGISMFILMSALIADFSVVLLDIRDKTIIGTKPIDQRTVAAAKLVHVMIYMTLLTGAFILIPTIAMVFAQGIGFALLFVFLMILFVLFIIACTSLVYILILQIFNGDQLKNIINYMQIILSIGIIIGYQIVIRAFDLVNLAATYHFAWWHLFLPPIWFGAPFELFINGNISTAIIVLSLMAILIPLIAIYMYYYLMPAFERNLEKLLETSGPVVKHKRRIRTIWEHLICRKEERVYFRFAYQMMSQERDFKLKVYPSLGMGLVFPFIFIFTYLESGSLSDLDTSSTYFYMYFVNIIIGSTVMMLQFSSQYKGAWIYRVVDLQHLKLIYSATLKAFFVKLYLPVLMIVGAFFFYIYSVAFVIDFAIILISAVCQTVLAYHIVIKEAFPFSAPFESVKESGNTGKAFLLLFMTTPFVIFHFLSSLIPYGEIGYGLLLFVLTMIIWKITFKK